MASERRLQILLDANVIFSGFVGTGPPRLLVDAAGESFMLLLTDESVNEVLRNIARKAPRALAALEEWFGSIDVHVYEVTPAAVTEYEGTFGKDAHIAAAPLSLNLDYVCTGDRALRSRLKDLVEPNRVVTPRELVDLFTL
jgi:predicted nucleic acid-binding protein